MAPTEPLTKPKSRTSPHSRTSFGKPEAAQKDHRKKIGFAPHINCDPGVEASQVSKPLAGHLLAHGDSVDGQKQRA